MNRRRTGGVRRVICKRCTLGEHELCVNRKALINRKICDCRSCQSLTGVE